MIRSFAERLVRGRSFSRRLPAAFGAVRMSVSGDARLRNLLPGREAFDPGLLAQVRATVTPEASIWDIGANVGVFAFAAAGLAGPSVRLHAVAPRRTAPNVSQIRLATR